MPYAATRELRIDHDGPVAVVTMNVPEIKNAFVDELHQSMREVWLHLAQDRSVRAAVLTGAGDAFSAGGHIPNFILDYDDPQRRRESLRGARRLLDAMVEFPKPLIAAVNGPAVGLGCSVAVSCDIIYIAESAFMSDPHVSVGLVAGDGGAVTWPLLMSIVKAKYYLLTGERIPAAACVELGLANFMVPDDKLMEEALGLAARLARQPQQPLEETKRAINLHVQAAIQRVAPFAFAAESESFSTDDLRQTVEKFKTKQR
jgi:enoyl-CoA hydratase